MDAGTHALLCSNANLTLLLNSNPVSADESENDRVRQSFAQLKSRGLLTATAQHTIQCASTHVCVLPCFGKGVHPTPGCSTAEGFFQLFLDRC